MADLTYGHYDDGVWHAGSTPAAQNPAVWQQDPLSPDGIYAGWEVIDPGDTNLEIGFTIPWNADYEYYAATGQLRIMGTEGDGTPYHLAVGQPQPTDAQTGRYTWFDRPPGGGTTGLADAARAAGEGLPSMNPYEVLARVVEMAETIGTLGTEGPLTLNELEGWIAAIRSAPDQWAMVKDIRSAVFEYRITPEAIRDKYDIPLGTEGDSATAGTAWGMTQPGADMAQWLLDQDEMEPEERNALITAIAASFPWASELGFLDLIEDLVVKGAGPEQIIAEVRQSEMYNKMFPGMLGPGGVRRYQTEREYINAVDDYRQVLKDHGQYDPGQDNPADYIAFMDAGIDPNELGDRFTTFEALERGTEDLRAAFYVYAGMEVTTDDLYQAVVSPQFRQELTNEYDRNVAEQPFDYETFIAKAHEMGKIRMVDTLETMQGAGVLTGGVVSRILALDDALGQHIMGALFTGGTTDAGPGKTLDLNELTEAFSAAIIGASATEAGFGMPTKERIEEFRQAGIQAAAVRSTYQNLAMRAPQLTGMLQRAGRGAELTRTPETIGSATLAEEEILGTTREITFAEQAETARGRRAGGFQTGQQGRRFTQPGRSMGD